MLAPGKELGRSDSRKYEDNSNTLQPIIRQGGSKRQPTTKENGRAEPVRGSQNRQVLFLEPPVAHSSNLLSPRRSDVMLQSRDLESPPYGLSQPPLRPLDPSPRRIDTNSRHSDIPLRHSELPMRRSEMPSFRHVDVGDRHDITNIQVLPMRHDQPSRHDLPPRLEYPPRHELAPRHIDPSRHDLPMRHADYEISPYARRRLCSDSMKVPPSNMNNPMYPPLVRNTTYHESLRNFDDRYSERDSRINIIGPPFSTGSSNTLSRESGYCSTRPPPGVFSSSAYRRHARSYDESSSPQPPLTSIMKKSPSVSAGDGRHPDPLGRTSGSHPTYRSLPRPGKSRAPDLEDLNRYRALDRRFDLPFTGSLPRPEPRRPIGGSRLRFADAKYFHVYPDKEKKQNRVVVDDADENFV